MTATNDRRQPTRPNVILPASERAALAALMRKHTILGAAAMLGIARHAMERAAGGLTIQRGTAALIRAALARIDHPTPEVL